MGKKLEVFFLCESFTGYQDFLNRKVSSPQGLPPVYKTWNGYVKQGHNIHIFTQDYNYEGYREWEHNKWKLYNLPAPFKYLRKNRFSKLGQVLFRLSRLIGLYRVYRKALALAREKPPDIVYSYSPWSSLPAAYVAKRYNAVHIMRRFGTTLYEVVSGKTSLWSNDGLIIEVLAYRLAYDLVVMANDGTMGDRASLHYGCPPEKLAFWSNGIDKTMYDPNFDKKRFRKEHNLPENCPIILWISRLVGWKSVDRAITVMKEVKKARPDARFILVGSGYLEQKLKEMAQELDVQDVIKFVRAVEHSEIKDYFNASDIYLQLFSLTNRCNPLYEAMCCQLPIVTIEGPGTEDLIFDGETALCVKSNSILQDHPVDCDELEEMEKAAQYVIKLLDDEQLRLKLGRSARQHLLKTLQTWDERISMEIEKVLSLVNSKHK